MNWEAKVLEFLAAALIRPIVLVVAAAVFLRMFRVSHPASRHAVWTVVLAGMLVAPMVSIIVPALDVPALPEGTLAPFENINLSLHSSPLPMEDASNVTAGTHAENWPSLAGTLPAGGDAGELLRESAMPSPGTQPARVSAAVLVLSIYVLGLVLLGAYRIAGWVLLRRLLHRSHTSRTCLRESPDVTVPMAAGVLNPVILLPAGWKLWDREKRRAVLRHEWEHLRRRDPLTLAFVRITQWLLWFHPLAWWVCRRMSELAEMACDAAALRRVKNPSSYSRILVEFAEDVRRRGYRATLPGLAMARPSGLSRRIDAVFASAAGQSRRLRRPVAVLLLVGIPVLTASATLRLTEAVARPLATVTVAVTEGLTVVPGATPLVELGNAVATTLESFVEVTSPAGEIEVALPPFAAARAVQSRLDAQEFLSQYCVSCHNQSLRTAGIQVENPDLSRIPQDRMLWEKVSRKLRHGLAHSFIPAPTPDPAAVRTFTEWLESELDREAPPFLRVADSHRLTRTEYGNAVRDLLGLDVNAALLLQRDDSSYGFDNIASAQSTTPAITQAFALAADNISVYAMNQGQSRNLIFVCRPESRADESLCATRIIESLVSRAFRGMATPEDGSRLFETYRAARQRQNFEAPFDTGIQAVLRAILTDPKFLYRTETAPANIASGVSYRISDLELASRLSFFLWSRGPDATLIAAASRGELQNPALLEREVRRMLSDPRAEALALNFAGQWLNIRGLAGIGPLPAFPDFDEPLRYAMRREAELFFYSIVQEDRSVVDLLTADYTFANERLARHYGIPNVQGNEFRRVSLGPQSDARRGLLGKGAILTVTSRADRTSLTTRAMWILRALLGTPPPDPPPNVPP